MKNSSTKIITVIALLSFSLSFANAGVIGREGPKRAGGDVRREVKSTQIIMTENDGQRRLNRMKFLPSHVKDALAKGYLSSHYTTVEVRLEKIRAVNRLYSGSFKGSELAKIFEEKLERVTDYKGETVRASPDQIVNLTNALLDGVESFRNFLRKGGQAISNEERIAIAKAFLDGGAKGIKFTLPGDMVQEMLVAANENGYLKRYGKTTEVQLKNVVLSKLSGHGGDQSGVIRSRNYYSRRYSSDTKPEFNDFDTRNGVRISVTKDGNNWKLSYRSRMNVEHMLKPSEMFTLFKALNGEQSSNMLGWYLQ